MAQKKKLDTLNNTLTSINTVMAALNAYPSLEDAVLARVQSEANKYLGKLFPTQLDFTTSILEHLVGTDVLIDIVSNFIVVGLPPMELAIKSVLLANMQNLGTNCTIDPFIYEKAIKEGVVFDLRQIDLYDKLRVNPLDRKIGQYFYFGTEGCESAYDILQSAIDPFNINEDGVAEKQTNIFLSNTLGHYGDDVRKRDFDCLLWYMKNKSVVRQVWGKRTTESESIFNEVGQDYNMVAVQDGNTYPFRNGNANYIYCNGMPSIYKLNRKKIYVYKKNGNTFEFYSFKEDSGNWISFTKNLIKYADESEAIQNSDKNIVGEIIWVNSVFKEITEYNEKKSTIKTRDCIDISDDVQNNISLFIDYEEKNGEGKTKGQLIKEGETPESSFNGENTGKRPWVKKKTTDDAPKTSNTCYYQDNDGDGKFTPNIDKILIPPYNEKGFITIKGANGKYTKDFGIVTLEYSPRTGNLKQSDGKPLHQQTPYDNVLHIFFGNVKELPDDDRDAAENRWVESAETNKEAMEFVREIEATDKFLIKVWKAKKKVWKKQGLPMGNIVDKVGLINIFEDLKFKQIHDYFKKLIDGGSNYIKTLPIDHPMYDDENKLLSVVDSLKEISEPIFSSENAEEASVDYEGFNKMQVKIDDVLKVDGQVGKYYTITAFTKRIAQLMDKNESVYYLKARNFKYPEPEKNYYLKRTLFEFNADYIASLQLFDPKVLAAQLITSLMGGISMHAVIGATATWKTDYIRDLVKDMVQKEIASEDYAISDCFFTFNNDAYNGMLRAAELRQAGLYSKHGEENGNNSIDPISMLDGLNEIDRAADQAGKVEVIKGVITTATGEIATDIYKEESYLSINPQFGLKASFIETLMTDLCTQMVMAILSPKVYLLILMNLEMFGLSTNFNEKTLLENFNNLLRNMIKSIVDYYMQYVMDKIMEIVEELAQRLMTKLAFEQVENYARLIKQILMHLRMFRFTSARRNSGWTQDFISSADITESNDEQEPVDEC